jgi:pyruvate kinase
MSELPNTSLRRTKIVATLGPATNPPEVLRQLVRAGLDVARLNFSHGTHAEHAERIALLRRIANEEGSPVTVLLDLQGPKIRVGTLSDGAVRLTPGAEVRLLPEAAASGRADEIPLDYPHLAEEARPGLQVLLADGAFELVTLAVEGAVVRCRVVQGGELRSRKGVNFPGLMLRLPAMTEKDQQDVEFGLTQDVDWISLSFVRSAEDVRTLTSFLEARGARVPVIAKIEKPQALEHLDEIIASAQGVMVARGDLGVEVSPEKVPLLQKRIIEACNRAGRPVITATQMLESMINEARPTRAEASDVANAILDGTDAVMLSGETSIGRFPVAAVEMMARIAREVESHIEFKSYPPPGSTEAHAIAEAVTALEKVVCPRAIVCLTTSGFTAALVAAERPRSPVVAMTSQSSVFHKLNLLWGIKPVLLREERDTFEELVALVDQTLRERELAGSGDRVLVLGGVPARRSRGTNFLKIHTLA